MSSTTSNPTPPPTAPARRPRRWWRILLISLGVVAGVFLAVYWYSAYTTAHALKAAIADAERDLPRWRLAEIEEDRKDLPVAENSALFIIGLLRKGKGVSFGGIPKYDDLFDKLPPNAQLNAQQLELIQTQMNLLGATIDEARRLKDMPKGRFPAKISDDFISTVINDHQNSRQVGDWLQHDAYLRAHNKQGDAAVESCRALINTGRAVADDPFLIVYLIRLVMQNRAVESLERVLAQCEPSDEALRQMQRCLEVEANESSLLSAMRGERAGFHQCFEKIQEGKIKPNWRSGMPGSGGSPVSEWLIDVFPSLMLKHYPELLHHMNKKVAAAKLTRHERGAEFGRLDTEFKESANPAIRQFSHINSVIHNGDCRAHASLHSARIAMACERYRIKSQGRWPDQLDDLVKAGLLDAVPTDPFDNQPLRYRRTKNGVVIYSVSDDGMDNGGAINRERPFAVGSDVGFQLWNVDQRRQAPQPLILLENVPGPGR